jgi:hypothetical protein
MYKQVNEGHSWGNWKANMNEYFEFSFPPLPSSVKSNQEALPLIMNLDYHLDSSLIQLDFDLSIPVKGNDNHALMDIQGKILSESLLTARESRSTT